MPKINVNHLRQVLNPKRIATGRGWPSSLCLMHGWTSFTV